MQKKTAFFLRKSATTTFCQLYRQDSLFHIYTTIKSSIKLFQDKKIRSVWNEEEEQWYFVVEDVVEALTDSADPKQYVKRMKLRDPELAKGWVHFVPTLIVPTAGGKQKMKCANVKGLFRIIQFILVQRYEIFS